MSVGPRGLCACAVLVWCTPLNASSTPSSTSLYPVGFFFGRPCVLVPLSTLHSPLSLLAACLMSPGLDRCTTRTSASTVTSNSLSHTLTHTHSHCSHQSDGTVALLPLLLLAGLGHYYYSPSLTHSHTLLLLLVSSPPPTIVTRFQASLGLTPHLGVCVLQPPSFP